MTDFDIVVAGHLCIDITPNFPATDARTFGELLVPGKLLNVGPCTVSTGGPVSNTGIALTKLGCRTLTMGKVGDDPFGNAVIDKMRQLNAADGIVVVPGEDTSYTVALAPPGIDRVFLHHPGANDTFGADDIVYEKLDQARVFHLGYPPLMRKMYQNGGRELIETLRRAHERGVTVSLDMSLPDPNSESGAVDWGAILEKALPYVDVFLPSAEEMLFALERPLFMKRRQEGHSRGMDALELFITEDYSRLSSRLLDYGPGIVALKSGHRGFYVRTGPIKRLERFGRGTAGKAKQWASRELWEPCFRVDQIMSATGSGDSAIAGFLASFLRGETLEEAIRYATAAGAQNVTAFDATSGVRSLDETKAMLADWPKLELSLEGAGWRYDSTGRRWHGPHDKPVA